MVITAVVLVVLAIFAWYLISPLFIATVGQEELGEGFGTVLATGTFTDGAPGHYGSGSATVLTDGASYLLRFEEFSVTNGPGLHVYLSRGALVGSGDLDLGALKASQGSSNYNIPAGIDPLEFSYVVIWCVPFSVQFAYAPLSPLDGSYPR